MIKRRDFVAGLMAFAGASALTLEAVAGPRRRAQRRRGRRRRRRRRRRIRRRVIWRTVNGRRLLVVPVALAIGWELMVDDHVVVVKEVHTEYVVVEKGDGSTEKIDVVKEDTEENSVELEGTEYEEEVEDDAGDDEEDADE